MNAELREFGEERLAEVRRLYEEAGWRAYLTDDERLKRAFRASLYVVGAFDGEELIGFIRCVGDGEHVVLIQDVIVKAAHRRQKIGTELIGRVLEKYRHVRMISLYTDAEDETDRCFYRSMGLRPVGERHMISYMK